MTKLHLLKAGDAFGKLLICWFGLATFMYFWSGRFFTEIESIPMFIRGGSYWWALHHMVRILVAGFGIVLMVPLLLKGHWMGLVIFLLYWAFGNFMNPLWYFFPGNWLVSPQGGPSILLWTINIFWSLVMALGIIAFFCSRRSLGLTLSTPYSIA